MADPIKFTPGYSYTVSVIPNFPGNKVDQDFANVETSIDEIVEAIKNVRRSDGKLKNGVVTPDSLSAGTLSLLLGGAGVTPATEQEIIDGVADKPVFAEQLKPVIDDIRDTAEAALVNDGTQIGVVQGLNVKPGNGSTLFARGDISLSEGISLNSRSDDYSEPRPLEISGSQVLITPTEDGVRITPPPSAKLDPKGFYVGVFPPTSGTQDGDYFMNRIEGQFKRTQTGTGLEGSDGSGIVNLFHVGLGVGGPNYTTKSASAFASGLVQVEADTNVGDKLGINSGVYTAFSTQSRLYGGSTGATIDTGGYAAQLCGFETDVFLNEIGGTPIRLGFNSWSGGKHQATDIDAAYAIGIRGGDIDGAPVAPWFDGIILFTGGGGNQPIDPAGNLLRADLPMTLNNIFNLENVTITGDILRAYNARITGAGTLVLGSGDSVGGIALNAPDFAATFTVLQQEGVPYWTYGLGTTRSFVISNKQTNADVFYINPDTDFATFDTDLGVTGLINGAVINENEWGTYTPVVSAQGGAIGAYMATARWRRLFGRTIIARLRIQVPTVGTATGALNFSLPASAHTGVPAVNLSGRESGTTGKGISGGLLSATQGYVFLADSLSIFTGGDGTLVDVSIIYEAAS